MADIDKVTEELNAARESGNFALAVSIIRDNLADLAKHMNASGIKDILRATTNDRLLTSFVDGVGFGEVPLAESLMRLEKLLHLEPNTLVLSKSIEWGLGVVKKLDYFYRRITVDFRMKRAHQFTFAAAVDMLTPISTDHILAIQYANPERFNMMVTEHQDDFVRSMIASFGPLSIQRLEDFSTRCGFLKTPAWKAFWEKLDKEKAARTTPWKAFWEEARTKLKRDKLVSIPVRRTDPIEIRSAAEDYGDTWLAAFGRETDPKLILALAKEYVGLGKYKDASERAKATVADRLAFAVTAARRVDDALYARLATLVAKLGLVRPTLTEMRSYLWERKRFVAAAAALPAKEVGDLIEFLSCDDEAKARIALSVPELCYTAVQEVVTRFGENPALRKIVADFLCVPKAPPTLVTLFSGSYERYREKWPELPKYIIILSHAIALGEGRQGGETLRMQNIVRRLFADKTWLEKVFAILSSEERAILFESFQASIAWEAASHHTIVTRMTHIDPALREHLVKVEKKKEFARTTSPRSYALKKAEYLKLINVDMPENVRKIEEAKGYGDLSENAEYQYAKDEQRVLMQKQSTMQADLEAVKVDEFASATATEVEPGVTVVVDTPEGEKRYTILGEWDNDEELGIISSRARLAANLLGKKAGDEFEMPRAEGPVSFGRVKEIMPLTDDIRNWMRVPEGMQI